VILDALSYSGRRRRRCLLTIGSLFCAAVGHNPAAPDLLALSAARPVEATSRRYPLPWCTPLRSRALSAVGSATPAELVAFAHAALFSPLYARSDKPAKVFCGGLSRSPQLRSKISAQSYATLKGHLQPDTQESTFCQSCCPASGTMLAWSANAGSRPAALDISTDDERCLLRYSSITGRSITDQTGRFIVPLAMATTIS
jgi:hypothetical protein